MHAFGKMGRFCGADSWPFPWRINSREKPVWEPQGSGDAHQFLEFLESLRMEGQTLRQRLSDLAIGTGLGNLREATAWGDFVDAAIERYRNAVGEWNEHLGELRSAWDEIPAQPIAERGREIAKANSIRHQIRALCEITVIEWLADHRFLPRYGFPINLQRLTVRKPIEGRGREYSEPDERYRLERSSLLALSEYVPESCVLVGGQVAVSRGLRKHWTDSNIDRALGLQYYASECQERHVFICQSIEAACPTCGGRPVRRQQLMFPRFGYTTAGWEPTRRGTSLERVGEQIVCPIAFAEHGDEAVIEDFGGVLRLHATYKEEASLLVRNAGRHNYGFAVCTRCGFAMSEVSQGEGRMNLPRDFTQHASVFSASPNGFCWERGEQVAPVLRNKVLAARELTDMLLIEWPGATTDNIEGVYSLGRALILAGSRVLELDQRELGVEILPLRAPSLGIVVFDTAPGGSGHCLELSRLGQEWIEAARQVLYVNEEHDTRCRRACLDCILDFSGQYRSSQLNRVSALQLLEDALAVT
jgi:hypothetical protein